MITDACNLACDYCYNPKGKGTTMSLETARKAVERTLPLINPGERLDLQFFGGEPLLVFDRLREIHSETLDCCAERNVALTSCLATNGTLLTPERYSRLTHAGIELMLSIDGLEQAQDMHRRFPDGRGSFATVRKLWENGIIQPENTALNLVLTPQNAGELPTGVAGLVDAGFRRFSFSPHYGTEWPSEARIRMKAALQKLMETYETWMQRDMPVYFSFIEEKVRRLLLSAPDWTNPCSFGTREIAVAPDGSLFPCERIIREGNDSPLCMGSVGEGHDFRRICNGDDVGIVRDVCDVPGISDVRCSASVRTSGDAHDNRIIPYISSVPRKTSDRCVPCPDRPACTNSCGCVNRTRTGDIDQPDELVCFFERMFIKAARDAARDLVPSCLEESAGGCAC
ncbi:MAG: radical SAM protein [Candidatus Ozemobacteraceae bacterium]